MLSVRKLFSTFKYLQVQFSFINLSLDFFITTIMFTYLNTTFSFLSLQFSHINFYAHFLFYLIFTPFYFYPFSSITSPIWSIILILSFFFFLSSFTPKKWGIHLLFSYLTFHFSLFSSYLSLSIHPVSLYMNTIFLFIKCI